MWWWNGDHNMGAGGWIGMGFMILFWIAVVVGIIHLGRYPANRPDSADGRKDHPPGRFRVPKPPGRVYLRHCEYWRSATPAATSTGRSS